MCFYDVVILFGMILIKFQLIFYVLFPVHWRIPHCMNNYNTCSTSSQKSLHKETMHKAATFHCIAKESSAIGFFSYGYKKRAVRWWRVALRTFNNNTYLINPYGYHLTMVYPSKNGVLRSPMYQFQSCWKIRRPYPKKFSSRAFNLDLVVTVSQPALLNCRSPLSCTTAIRLLCKNTSERFPILSTRVLLLCHDTRLLTALFICCSIFLIGALVEYFLIITAKVHNATHLVPLI